MATQRQPRFVVVEGLDGAGTTTQASRLAEALTEQGRCVELTSEPSSGPLGQLAREHIAGRITLDPASAALTFTADRADHLARTIRPALDAGHWVVCDRYLLSTLAYQGAEGVDPEWMLTVSAGFEVPELTVLLDLPDALRRERLDLRGVLDRYETPELAGTLRASYRDAVELLRANGHRIEVVAAAGTPGEVTDRILERLERRGPG